MHDMQTAIITVNEIQLELEFLTREITSRGVSNLTQEYKDELWDIFEKLSSKIEACENLEWMKILAAGLIPSTR